MSESEFLTVDELDEAVERELDRAFRLRFEPGPDQPGEGADDES